MFRNYVVVTVSHAIDRVRSASDSVDRFINEHFLTTFLNRLRLLRSVTFSFVSFIYIRTEEEGESEKCIFFYRERTKGKERN